MIDPYRELFPLKVNSPAEHAAAVTPADDTDLEYASRALYIGVTGDIKVDMVGGEEAVTFSNVPVCIFPIRVERIYSTDTTATNIVSLW